MTQTKVRMPASGVISVILLICVIHVHADLKNPLKDPTVCGRPLCETDDTKFNYQINTLYDYTYNMFVRTEFAGSGQNTSELHAVGHVHIIFPKKCEGILRLKSIELHTQAVERQQDVGSFDNSGSDDLHPKSDEFGADLQKHDLRFSFHDGLISEVCSDDDEPTWALNLKKAILSTFQNTMTRFDIDFNATETDVSGTCDVHYALIGTEKTSLLMQKTKEIGSCKNRYKTESFLQTTPYDFRNNYAAWPILNSKSYCNISIDHHIYNNVDCHERHLLAPFSNNETGAVTETRITLSLESDTQPEIISEDQPPIKHRSTLLFDHTPSPKTTKIEVKASREYLKQMCKMGFPDIQREFPDVFVKFLSATRLLSHAALEQLLQRASSICANGKNHVMESLPYIGSTASVLLMKDQIVKKKVTQEVASDWMWAISFMTRPTPEIVEAMFELVKFGKNNDLSDFILGSSAVVASYCRHNSCPDDSRVLSYVKVLEDEFMEIFSVVERENNRKAKDYSIVLLKALGNVGVVQKKFETFLKRKFVEVDDLPTELRLQGVSTFRRTDCLRNREYFLDIYKNHTINNEIRIASYLQSMRCPDYISIKFIKHVLKTEKVNQVGSFVWSHLHNLLKSASPVQVEIQGLLADGDIGSKFKLDFRKYSKNYERSLFFDEYNFGVVADSNVIFGTDSYLPKTISLNFTADVFGESINFFELNTRAEGFEHLVESVFGPKGPLNAEYIQSRFKDLYHKFMNYTGESFEPIEDYMLERRRRALKGAGSVSERGGRAMRDELENSINKFGYKMPNNPSAFRATLGMKIFGNDLRFRTSDGGTEFNKMFNYLSPMTYINAIFSGKDFTYTKSGIFLDSSYQVPLVSGMPLTINALGASSVDLRYSGRFSNISKNYDIETRLKPSVSVDVISTMKADLFYGACGVKVKANLYSSAAVESKLRINMASHNQAVSLQINLPQERNEILSVRSEMLVLKYDKGMRQDREIKQRGFRKRYANSTCTWPIVERAVGLKLCADYSLPDVSKTKLAHPSLILSGPVKLDIHLDKTDPSARTYHFLFNWNEHENMSEGSITFETPGSVIPRIFSANVSKSMDLFHASMHFKNGDTSHSAVGNYFFNETTNELELSLNLNEQKYLQLEMGMNRTSIKNGFSYSPRFLLAIKKDKIAGMIGKINVITKKEIRQWDVELKFETKRLKSKCEGYVIRSPTSLLSKMGVDYRFVDTKEEHIDVEIEYADRSKIHPVKVRNIHVANLKLSSTAYPKLNFVLNNQLQNSQGHIELKTEYDDAPDLKDPNRMLTTKITFAKFGSLDAPDAMTTNVALQITRPFTHTDFLLRVSHEERFKRHEEKLKRGKTHNVVTVLRYAPGKEIKSIVSVYFPVHSSYGFDLLLNITAPSFQPCTINFILTELTRKDYDIIFNGTWFSGHSMNVKGWFQDRSSQTKRHNHLKLLVQSPSFEETTMNVRYSLDEFQIKLDAHAKNKDKSYAVILKHSYENANHTLSYGEVRYDKKLYWVKANLVSEQPKQLSVEMHLDRHRNIELNLRGISIDVKSEAMVEVKWDANRDPTQKLVVSVEFNTPIPRTYNGKLLVSYPERAFSGIFDLHAVGPEYKGSTRLSWSPTEAIDIKLNSGAKTDPLKDVWLWLVIDTPFVGWRHNKLSSGVYHDDNLLLANASFLWAENQQLGFEFLGDYKIDENLFKVEVRTAVNSTVKDIPPVSAHVKHLNTDRKIETEASVKYQSVNGTQNYYLLSGWEYDKDAQWRKVSGSVAFRSPFEKFTRGTMVTKIAFSDKKEIRAAADAEFEDRRYTLVTEGYLKKVSDCWFVTNVTTPIEKFSVMTARFGINEREKHAVAEVSAPMGALGVEVLFYVMNSNDFNIKLSVATPLDGFSKLMLIAKKNPDELDLRGGWNNVTLGFTGVWRFASVQNFEYSYKVYTLIELLEYNGVVIKFVRASPTDIDMDMSLKLANYKLGITSLVKPKPMLILALGKQKSTNMNKFLFNEDFLRDMLTHEEIIEEEEEGSSEESNESSENIEELMSFSGNFKIDTIVYPTVKGVIDVDQIDDINYLTSATIDLPQGTIELKDRFYFHSITKLKNRLNLVSPFPFAKEVKSNVMLRADLGEFNKLANYVTGFDVSVLNREDWIDVGLHVNLTRPPKLYKKKQKMYKLNVRVTTPLKGLPFVDFTGLIETEAKTYHGNISVLTQTTQFSLGGLHESDANLFNAEMELSLAAPLMPYYHHRIYVQKSMKPNVTEFLLGFVNNDNGIVNQLNLDGDFTLMRVDSPYKMEFNGHSKLTSTILPIPSIEATVQVESEPARDLSYLDLEVIYVDQEGNPDEIVATFKRDGQQLRAFGSIPFPDYRNVSLIGRLTSKDDEQPNKYNLVGNFIRNSDMYKLDGDVTIVSHLPVQASLKIKDAVGGSSSVGFVSYSLQKKQEKFTLNTKITKGQSFTEVSGEMGHQDDYNWGYKLLTKSSEPDLNNIAFDLRSSSEGSNHEKILTNFEVKTSWDRTGLNHVRIGTDTKLSVKEGWIRSEFELPSLKGSTGMDWNWLIMKKMRILLDSNVSYSNGTKKVLKTGVSYEDDDGIITTGNIHVNDVWKLKANATYGLTSEREHIGTVAIHLPLPVGDIHKLQGSLFTDMTQTDPLNELTVKFGYESVEANKKYTARGHYKNNSDIEASARVEWGHDPKSNASQLNLEVFKIKDVKKGEQKHAVTGSILTPYYLNEETVKVNIVYGVEDIYQIISSSLYIPASVKTSEADIVFAGLSNMKGKVNSTTPFLNITWLEVDFDFNTDMKVSTRFLNATWPNNSAIIDAKTTYNTFENGDRDQQGIIKLEVPVQTRHVATIIYGLKERPVTTHGHATIEYNDKNILNGQYKGKVEVRGNQEKNIAQITLENEFYPLGINYFHTIDKSEEILDLKRAEVFELNKNRKFNITGELHVKTLTNGTEYKVVAIHPNRTVVLTSDYFHEDDETRQKSMIELEPTIWIGYDVHLRNLTTTDNETTWFLVEIFYPKRNLSSNGSYSMTEDTFDADVEFKWLQNEVESGESTTNTEYDYDYNVEVAEEGPKEIKVHQIRAGFTWRVEPQLPGDKDNQSVLFSLRHPSFEKDITFKGNLYRSDVELLKLNLLIDYAIDEFHLVNFTANIRDLTSIVGHKNYTAFIYANHEASELNLNGFGTIGTKGAHYEVSGFGGYKRGYLPLQDGTLLTYGDLKTHEVRYYRSVTDKINGVWLKFNGNYPMYIINGTYINTPDYDSTGFFILDLWEKCVQLDIDFIPDASQNLRMYGTIPDSRQAHFDLHRDYEDIRVTDIAYYIKMNHSRLITSHFIWRPTLEHEVKETVKTFISDFYSELSDTIDYWIRTIFLESKEIKNDIVRETVPFTEGLMNDIYELRAIESDLNDLMEFVNKSYQADDFYIRSVLNFTLTVLDELAVKNHIASVPKIFKEMWQLLGESGETLRKSIMWLLDTLQKSYKNAVETISGILHGDALTHLSTMIESGVKKYDKFTKDLHVSFIKYVERLYTRMTEMFQSYWERALQNIQPSIMKLINYLEDMTWSVSKEVFDFLYERTDEFVKSPYFNQFYNITHDFDRLYKDLMENDAITNIRKYSILTYKFLKEKYFKLVPFGKELNELLTELQDEIKALEKLEFIQMIEKRMGELQQKLEWIAEEFQIEKRMHQLMVILRNKFLRYAQTALQSDDKYREAKTKFIFDPDKGVIELEQKLPMSWHSFNETPMFDEIPEYKMLIDFQEYFATSNFTIWGLVYDINRWMEISTWLPPFKAHSILIGSRHFITFDGAFISMDLKYEKVGANKIDQCSYLLARDFLNQNFTLLMEPSILQKDDELIVTRKLTMIVDGRLIDIDITADAVRFGRNLTTTLPARIGETVIYRESDVLKIESTNGFSLECNLQFDICSFDVIGWYYGKTAGILGTMNNEIFDDTSLMSNGRCTPDEEMFVNSWSLPRCDSTVSVAKRFDTGSIENKELHNVCELFFKSKVSYFTSCFPIIDSSSFYDMCLDLGMSSLSNIVNDPHPSIRGACTAALAYIEVCDRRGTPLRVPDSCIHCNSIDGTFVPEGSFVNFTTDNMNHTSDIVFIIEAKDCNQNINKAKSLMTLVTNLNKEFESSNITNNRYAVVAFGGQPPFDVARSVVVNNHVFTDVTKLQSYFDHIHISNGTNHDLFEAISFASKLLFRPGASKTFIILPCSTCSSLHMDLDYSTVLQALLENGVTMHLITDYVFEFDKLNEARNFFGIDDKKAYTKADFKELKGSEELRTYVQYPKKQLKNCAPLALQTNGSIFTSNILRSDRNNLKKKFSTVFGKRVALTAHPNECQVCECTGHNTGVAYMICTPCDIPIHIYPDLELEIDDIQDDDDDEDLEDYLNEDE